MPLSSPQREHLAKRLREERERVLRVLGRYDEELAATEQDAAGDLSKFPFHPADEGTDAFDRELDAQEASRLTRELAEIDAALERLYGEPERFGRDERTGEEIPFERLDVIPWARERVDDPPAGATETRVTDADARLADHNERYAG
jgi:RNA polymerase-binding transcription factor DksA